MTLLELEQSTNPIERFKGSVLTLKELDSWLENAIYLSSELQEHFNVATQLKTTFDQDFRYTLMTIGKIPLCFKQIDQGQTFPFSTIAELFGNSDPERDGRSKLGRVWLLDIKDWPFLTVELVGKTIVEMAATRMHHEPGAIRETLPAFFPNTKYVQLLEMYKNDLLSIEPNEQGLPTLREVMYQQNTMTLVQPQPLPSDFGM